MTFIATICHETKKTNRTKNFSPDLCYTKVPQIVPAWTVCLYVCHVFLPIGKSSVGISSAHQDDDDDDDGGGGGGKGR